MAHKVNIKPIGLPNGPAPQEGKAIFIGWGSTSLPPLQYPNSPRMTEFELSKPTECTTETKQLIKADLYCINSRDSHIFTGDSGGALFAFNATTNSYEILGMASMGVTNADKTYTCLFAKLYPVKSWLQSPSRLSVTLETKNNLSFTTGLFLRYRPLDIRADGISYGGLTSFEGHKKFDIKGNLVHAGSGDLSEVEKAGVKGKIVMINQLPTRMEMLVSFVKEKGAIGIVFYGMERDANLFFVIDEYKDNTSLPMMVITYADAQQLLSQLKLVKKLKIRLFSN